MLNIIRSSKSVLIGPSKADRLKDLEELRKQGLSDPKEILRFLQKELEQGSNLDVTRLKVKPTIFA